MVIGLLRGIGGMFNEQVSIDQVEAIQDGAEHDVFALTIASTAPAPPGS
jgi:hypothetical protein